MSKSIYSCTLVQKKINEDDRVSYIPYVSYSLSVSTGVGLTKVVHYFILRRSENCNMYSSRTLIFTLLRVPGCFGVLVIELVGLCKRVTNID